MPGSNVFEYAVIRIVPRVEREEFINAGVILFCKGEKTLDCIININIDDQKLNAFVNKDDLDDILVNLNAFSRICKGDPHCGAIAELDQASRFRWLTATRSTVVQASKVHPGLTDNAAKTLQKLFEQLVA